MYILIAFLGEIGNKTHSENLKAQALLITQFVAPPLRRSLVFSTGQDDFIQHMVDVVCIQLYYVFIFCILLGRS